MFSFLQPQWLWAAAAMAIPILIHLWNISNGKVLKIGSIAFIAESSRKSSNRLKISELLLLFLRCLLILLLSIFLAQPEWLNQQTTAKEKGWIIADGFFSEKAYSGHAQLIDSLYKAGYIFKKADTALTEVTYSNWKTELKKAGIPSNYSPWNLVRHINRKAPGDFPVYILTGNRLREFEGLRPQTHADLHWVFNEDSITNEFAARAWLINSDSLIVSIGSSNASGTIYRLEKISLLQPPPGFRIVKQNERLTVGFKNTLPTKIDTGSIKVIVATDPGKSDGDYISAALNAVSSTTGLPIEIKKISSPDIPSQSADWLFWLSEKPVPSVKDIRNILKYETGKLVAISSSILNKNEVGDNSTSVRLSKKISNNISTEIYPVWTDGFGDPILFPDSENSPVLNFQSRFDPSWNELVWNQSFPGWIYQLLMQDNTDYENKSDDLRAIDSSQVRPEYSPSENTAAFIPPVNRSLSKWFWWLLLIIFCVERFLSLQSKSSSA